MSSSISIETPEEVAGRRFSASVGLANALSGLAYACLAGAMVTWPALGLLEGSGGYAPCFMFVALFVALFLAVRALSDMERSLAFSRVLAQLSNPALPAVDVMSHLCAHMRLRQGAARCLVLVESEEDDAYRLFSAARGHAVSHRRLNHAAASSLLTLPANAVMLYDTPRWRRSGGALHILDRRPCAAADLESAREISNLIEARSFLCLPLHAGERIIGRVLLVQRAGWLARQGLPALQADLTQVAVVLGNHARQSKLLREAQRRSRERLARDLHDGPLQSQVGVKLGLEALVRQLGPQHRLHPEASELMRVTQEGVIDLRAHIESLRKPDTADVDVAVMAEIQRQARRFTALHGIDVQIIAPECPLTARSDLCEQIGLIVREGLCNIRRHTRSPSALVSVASETSSLKIELMNEIVDHTAGEPRFRPRSLVERTAELGGEVNIATRFGRYTVVTITVPL